MKKANAPPQIKIKTKLEERKKIKKEIVQNLSIIWEKVPSRTENSCVVGDQCIGCSYLSYLCGMFNGLAAIIGTKNKIGG